MWNAVAWENGTHVAKRMEDVDYQIAGV